MSKESPVIDLKAAKAERERKCYAALVLQKFSDMEHADKRAFLDRKAEVEIAARERL
jgi:hypothetical protein